MALVVVSGVWVMLKVPRIEGEGRPEMGLLRRLDLVGALLFGVAVTMLMLFLISLTDEIFWWMLPFIAVFSAVWVWWELRMASLPFIDLRAVAANRQLANTLGRTMVTYAAFYCLFWAAAVVRAGRGMSVSQTGR